MASRGASAPGFFVFNDLRLSHEGGFRKSWDSRRDWLTSFPPGLVQVGANLATRRRGVSQRNYSCFPPWLVQVEANLVARLSSVIPRNMAATKTNSRGCRFTIDMAVSGQTWLPFTQCGRLKFAPTCGQARVESVSSKRCTIPDNLQIQLSHDHLLPLRPTLKVFISVRARFPIHEKQ